MIYLAGDTHGELEVDKVTEFFKKEMQLRDLSEEDYVITHTVPGRIARQLVGKVLPGEERLQDYLQEISMHTSFKR